MAAKAEAGTKTTAPPPRARDPDKARDDRAKSPGTPEPGKGRKTETDPRAERAPKTNDESQPRAPPEKTGRPERATEAPTDAATDRTEDGTERGPKHTTGAPGRTDAKNEENEATTRHLRNQNYPTRTRPDARRAQAPIEGRGPQEAQGDDVVRGGGPLPQVSEGAVATKRRASAELGMPYTKKTRRAY